jgi:hypothetical protein
MFQGSDPRMLRTAAKYSWTLLRLRIAEEMILRGGKARETAFALGTTYDNLRKELHHARKEYRQQAMDECDPEAYTAEARLAEEPEGVIEKAKALRFAMDNEPNLEVCIAAVRIIDGHWKYTDGSPVELVFAES